MEKRVQLPLFVDKSMLPTGKHHLSFSEFSVFSECSFHHYLVYVKKLGSFDGNQFTIFGLAVHLAMEEFLLSHNLHSYDHQVNIENSLKFLKEEFLRVKFEDVGDEFQLALVKILNALPKWLNESFPGWETVSSEALLFEAIEGQKNKYFKGFADGLIRYPAPPRKGSKPKPGVPIKWQLKLIDYKSCGWGWTATQKMDPIKRMQLVLYKYYTCKKLGLPLKDVKCSFLLCKRTAKEDKCIEEVDVSAGPITIENALKKINIMIGMVAKGWHSKNKSSCVYCEFKNTAHCP